MAPALLEGLTVQTLIAAKGAELKFWIIKTNEAAGEKVLKVSGTVELLRTNLAGYYGLDLTVIPRVDAVTVPTIDESIRDRQWADLVALGVEWRETVKAGGVFKLLNQASESLSTVDPGSLATQNEIEGDIGPLRNTQTAARNRNEHTPPAHVSMDGGNRITSMTSTLNQNPNFAHGSFHSTQNNHSRTPAINNQSTPTVVRLAPGPIDTSRDAPSQSHHPNTLAAISDNSSLTPAASDAASQHEAAILDDLSETIAGIERCEGLREVIQQIESGAVQAIRNRYGPTEYGRRGTAHELWPRYSNLVSKRERLHRILTQDFGGNKDKFFDFFAVPAPAKKKRKRDEHGPSATEEHFRSFRKIVEAVPWLVSFTRRYRAVARCARGQEEEIYPTGDTGSTEIVPRQKLMKI